jgi:hypothetical protein
VRVNIAPQQSEASPVTGGEEFETYDSRKVNSMLIKACCHPVNPERKEAASERDVAKNRHFALLKSLIFSPSDSRAL